MYFLGAPTVTKKTGPLNKKVPLPPISQRTAPVAEKSSSSILLESTLRESIAASDIDIDVEHS